MTGNRSDWLIGGASVRGSAHIRRDRPNQDAIAWSPPGGRGGRIVGAVSDGHGAALHFRSGVGSRFAVERAVEIIAWHLDEGEADEAEGALAGEILTAWRRAVDDHLGANPLEEGKGPPSMLAYGATLIALGGDDKVLTMLQIGDGDLLLGYGDGRLERPLHADAGLIGEETYSLCQSDAETRFRVATMWRDGGRDWPDFALLATDGVAKSFRDEAAFVAAAGQFRTMAGRDWGAMIHAMPDWLAEVSAKGSGDDSTICIALRRRAGTEQEGDEG
jgi:hypothetical protein